MSRPVSGVGHALTADQLARLALLIEEAAIFAGFEAQELAVDHHDYDAASARQRRDWYQTWLSQPEALRTTSHPLIAAAVTDHASPSVDAWRRAGVATQCPSVQPAAIAPQSSR